MSGTTEKATEVRGEPATESGGFDQTLVALRQVVERLESGSLSLEASLQAFEEGIGLARRGTQILDAAEQRVEVLTKAEPSKADSEPAMKIETFSPSPP